MKDYNAKIIVCDKCKDELLYNYWNVKIDNEKEYIMCPMCKNEVLIKRRENKIKFLLNGEKELGKEYGINYSNKYGDFTEVSDEKIDELFEELDWLWK